MSVNAAKLIKSPLNYTGGKFKLLPQILPLFPKKIDTFVDLFCGGCNVAINVCAKKIICNDHIHYLIDLFKELQQRAIEDTIRHIESRIEQFRLSKENQEGFIALRELYNKERNILDLYVLACYSFNHVIRFNKNHEYNAPFGKYRSHFSRTLKQKLMDFITTLKNKNIEFTNRDFEIDIASFSELDFFYCDPPYLISQGVYNDGRRGFDGWTLQHEYRLLKFLDKLHKKKIKFALSNVFENKGLKNEVLMSWCKENGHYVYEVNSTYRNSSYQRKDRGASTEVVITNYEVCEV